jgi:Zn-dependent protease with chaperone function
MAVLAPLAAMLVQMAVSRSREFQLFSTHPPIEERIARLRAMRVPS